jgi:hypothetical protein
MLRAREQGIQRCLANKDAMRGPAIPDPLDPGPPRANGKVKASHESFGLTDVAPSGYWLRLRRVCSPFAASIGGPCASRSDL